MFSPLRDLLDLWDRKARFSRYSARSSVARYLRAWRYATQRLSADEAQQIAIDCRFAAGWHPLLTLAVEDVLDLALEEFNEHPDLRRLVAEACARVGYKWEPYGDALSGAQDWALDLVRDYAAADGITLVRHADSTDDCPDPNIPGGNDA